LLVTSKETHVDCLIPSALDLHRGRLCQHLLRDSAGHSSIFNGSRRCASVGKDPAVCFASNAGSSIRSGRPLSWTNHVGVVVDVSGAEPLVAESTIPWSRTTGLKRFVARSQGGRFSVSRLNTELTEQQKISVIQAAASRSGVLYDTGFDLTSKRQFCSRYVREVLFEATGKTVGEVETFKELLSRNPATKLGFWRAWYLGEIPWERTTVTPASVLNSPELHSVFDGVLNRAFASAANLNASR
jgi:Permuted papain-like amidase enzyme, YaeF/YiiX, C92 family